MILVGSGFDFKLNLAGFVLPLSYPRAVLSECRYIGLRFALIDLRNGASVRVQQTIMNSIKVFPPPARQRSVG